VDSIKRNTKLIHKVIHIILFLRNL